MDFSDITIKSHPRARRVKIKASVRNGIEVIVPLRFNQKELPAILERNKAWIDKQLARIQQTLNTVEVETFPKELHLAAINQHWKVIYIKTKSPKIKIMLRPLDEIILMGDIDNKVLCKKVLTQWLRKQAEQYLIPLLKKVSDETQLSYSAVSIRAQQTRWGSCTSDKAISLNFKLIFLPEILTRHIMIHELAHTVHLNHSFKFWRLVAQFDSNWKAHNALLRKADLMIPGWFI